MCVHGCVHACAYFGGGGDLIDILIITHVFTTEKNVATPITIKII